MALTVAIIGRPNVGKSTLFNRLVGKKVALVDNTPGLTRDRREGAAAIGELSFSIIDTAGLEDAEDDTLESKMMEQTQAAIEEADLLFMLVDGREGIIPGDEFFADWARRTGKPVQLIINKCEGKGGEVVAAESYRLGLGDPILISAEHGQGMGAIYEVINAHVSPQINDEINESEEKKDVITIAIIGRPNVGKSTLLNSLLSEERSITGAEAGITRDAIYSSLFYGGREITLVDTAGMRKKANINERIEKMSVDDTIHAIHFAHVVIVLLDGTQGLEKQDLSIANLAYQEGRPSLIAVNKWDIVTHKTDVITHIEERIETSLSQLHGVPLLTLSALEKQGVEVLLDQAITTYDIWNKRISTAKLNDWLTWMVDKHPPPLVGNRRIKLRYMTQIATRPARFSLFTNEIKQFPEHYLRYLIKGLREEFELPGVPIRIFLRKGKNPYAH